MGGTNPGPPRADVLPREPGHPSSPLFDGMDAAARTAFLSELEWFTLPGGVLLFEENEPSDAFYIVIAGCLDVVGRTSAGADELIGRVRTGETIGELELLGGRPRAMTVVALRDSSLLRVTKLACETLSQRDPRAMLQLIVQFFARLQWPRRPGTALQAPNTVALTRLGATVFIEAFAQSLARRVTAQGFTANVINAGTADTERTYAILEAAHSLIIDQGETQTRAGSSCVCGGAGGILLIADTTGRSPRDPLPFLDASRRLHWRALDMVLLQSSGQRLPAAADPSAVFAGYYA